jgi:predicted RNase H-like HicB family nuclease
MIDKKNSKKVYPVILTPLKSGGFCVTMPDFGTHTEGSDLANAIDMAKDALEMMGVFLQDEGKTVPEPSKVKDVKSISNEIVTLITVDFNGYRRKTETKAVKKTLSLPSWLNVEAEEAGINFSATLQEALKEKLEIA